MRTGPEVKITAPGPGMGPMFCNFDPLSLLDAVVLETLGLGAVALHHLGLCWAAGRPALVSTVTAASGAR